MPETLSSIDNLTKVSLEIQINNAEKDDDQSTAFTFIVGTNPAGFTSFEKALYGKGVGDQLDFEITQADFCDSIGHLATPLQEQTGIDGPASLHVTVTGIIRPEDREVVKALAGGGGCGDCDCGCGGH